MVFGLIPEEFGTLNGGKENNVNFTPPFMTIGQTRNKDYTRTLTVVWDVCSCRILIVMDMWSVRGILLLATILGASCEVSTYGHAGVKVRS